jgi:phosphodiesterase/alkaline phosphatase D-like protein
MRTLISAGAAIAALICAATAIAAASPAVTPGTVSSIAETAAVLNGTVNPNGAATTYQFDWGLTPSLGNVTPAAPASAGAGTTAVAESAKITGLSPDTTYYYELRASNGSGSASTPAESFKTNGNPAPTSTTDAAAGVGRYAATLVGTVNPDNQTTTYYFQYGLTANYSFQTNVQTVAAGSTPLTVTASLPGIEPGTVFHYRLVASHGATSTTYGNDATFQTAPFPRPLTHFTFAVAAQNGRRFVAQGRISVPYTTPSSYGCQGTMRIRYYRGAHLLVTRYVPIGLSCTYAEATHITGAPAGASLTVRARYSGDLYDAPSLVKQVTVVNR